jgi:hypothetical protein
LLSSCWGLFVNCVRMDNRVALAVSSACWVSQRHCRANLLVMCLRPLLQATSGDNICCDLTKPRRRM